MPGFVYKVRNKEGELLSGVIQGNTPEEVAVELFSRGFVPIDIRHEKNGNAKGLALFSSVQPQDLIVFTRQLATLIKAGISFMKSLDTLYDQTRNKKLKSIISEVRKTVGGGASFSDALGGFPDVFPNLYVSMIKVGEEAGVLDDILERLATLLEHDAQTRARVKTALRYPMLVIGVLFAAFIFLTTFVVPKFAAIFASSKAELPMPTKILIALNKLLTNYWMFLIAGAVLLIIFLRAYVKTSAGRWNWDLLKLKMPIIGSIVEKSVMSRFARIFSTLYKSGIPILHTLDIVSGTLGNVIIGRAVDMIKSDVREGKSLAEPMLKSGTFPPIVVQMVSVGEETGSLDDMLVKVSDYYDTEVEYEIRNLSTTIEPILIVILAGGVLFLALGIFLPIWDMISVLKK